MKQFILLLSCFLLVFGTVSFTQTTPNLNSVQMLNSNEGIAVGSGGAMLRTVNGGVTWTILPSVTSLTLTSVSFGDVNVGWSVGSNALYGYNVILKTTSSGVNWFSQSSGLSVADLKGISAGNNSLAVIVGKNQYAQGLILRTTNGGTSWSNISGAGGNPLYSVCFVDASTVIAVGWAGVVLKSTDGGATWVQKFQSSADIFTHVRFINSSVGIIVGSGGVIFKTTNGGESWTEQKRGGADLYSVSMADANIAVAVGAYGTILKTANGGSTWTSQTSGSPYALQGISLIDQSTGIVVGGSGTILRTDNGGSTWIQQTISSGSAPSTPTLSSPLNGAVNQPTTLTLSWNASSGATSYRLQVSNSSTFSTLIVDDGTLTGTSKQVGPLSNSTTYYWRVSATNVSGTSSYSTVWSFITIAGAPAIPLAPVLLSPTNGAIDQSVTPTLSWNASSGATSYRLQVSNSSTFSTLIVDDGTLTGTSKQVGPLSNSTTYYWRVSATNVSGTSPYSTVWSFTTLPLPPAAPTLISPSNGSLDQPTTLTLNWNASSGATSYRLQVSTSSAFSSTIVDVTQSGNSKQVGPLTNSTIYYWRVSASNSGGTSAYSSVWNFTVLAVQKTSSVFNVDKKSIDFGSVTVGTKKRDSVVVSNTGNADLTISNIVSTNSKFTITPTSATIASGASQKVYITFSPSRKIVYLGNIVFTHNATNVRDTVSVSGTGIGVVKTTGVKVLSFAFTQLGTTQVQNFTVYNEGGTPLEISNISSTNDAFTANLKIAVVEPADSLQISVTAKPKSEKKENGFIVIQYAGADDLDSVAVELDVVLSVKQNDINYPGSFALHQNYPNPFNPSTRITVDLPTGGQARLVIYNILGEQVTTLMSGTYAPGSYEVTWSGQDDLGSQVPSGIYIYKLDAGSFSQTKKMQLMK